MKLSLRSLLKSPSPVFLLLLSLLFLCVFSQAQVGPSSGFGCTVGCSYVLTTSDQQWAPAGTGGHLTTANQGQYVRFYNNAQRTLGNACIYVATNSAGGTLDVGVFSSVGVLLWHTGALSTTSTGVQCVTPTAVTLPSGNYYEGWCADNTTAAFAVVTNSGDWELISAGSGVPAHTYGTNATDTCSAGVLPSTITPTNITNSSTQTSLPYINVIN